MTTSEFSFTSFFPAAKSAPQGESTENVTPSSVAHRSPHIATWTGT